MGLVSSRSRAHAADRLRAGVPAHDVVEVRAGYDLGIAPGLIVVLAGYPDRRPRRHVGKVATLAPPAGTPIRATVAEAKTHGPTISLYFEGLTKADVPIGSLVSVAD